MTTQTFCKVLDILNYSKNHGELIYLHIAVIMCVNFMQLNACAIIIVYISNFVENWLIETQVKEVSGQTLHVREAPLFETFSARSVPAILCGIVVVDCRHSVTPRIFVGLL